MSEKSSDQGQGRSHEWEVSVRLQLLDMQLLDAAGLPVGRVDDIELERSDASGGAALHVAALLIGQRHLGPRVGGLTGKLLTHTAHRLAEHSSSGRVPASMVGSWSGMPRLRRHLADLDIAGLEKWLSARIVRKTPGADDAGI